MKRLANIFTIIIVLTSLSVQLKAQQPDQRPPRMLPGTLHLVEMMKHLAVDLNLSEDQSKQFKEISTAHVKDFQQLLEKGRKLHDQQRAEMDALKEKFEGEVLSILTKEQQAMFQKQHNRDRHAKCKKKQRFNEQ
ncbi:hypothetical protein ACUNWD_09740 [Sunxiuqinia sp. A32]|uniref:hypothetical protein n=1 Tax=Sunxiuqinia sp. A32 TaxID=3461496 RepID=UPI0040464E08